MIRIPRLNKIMINNSFLLFIISQMVSYFADAFTMIALTALLIKLTGSGKLAGFNVICVPVASLFLSSLAGSLGDRSNEKYFLALMFLLKALISLAFLTNHDLPIILTLMLSLAALEVVVNPPRRKLLARLLKNSDMMVGNSILTGVMGFAYISGPLICGIIIDIWGINLIFIANGCFYFLACLILLFLKNTEYNAPKLSNRNHAFQDILIDLKKGYNILNKNTILKASSLLLQ